MSKTTRLQLSLEPADCSKPYVIFNELVNFLENNLYITAAKSYAYVSRQGAFGTSYLGGFYESDAADANLTQAALTAAIGSANCACGAHAFIVAGAAGSTDGSDLVLTVSGTSITDAGVRTAADSEVIVADCSAAATDGYYETTKKWLGTVTFTLSSTGGATFSFDFNYGLAYYEDFGNRAFTLTDIDFTGLANASDSGFDISILHHQATGWTYAATGFVPGPAAVYDMNSDHGAESELVAGEHFAWKRSALTEAIDGAAGEGVIIRVTTSANSAIAYMVGHLTATLDLL